jgi:hypothetical protein
MFKKLFNISINVVLHTNIHGTDLIFRGSPLTPPRKLCADIYSRRVAIPLEKNLPRKNLRGLQMEVIEFTINNSEGFLEITNPRTFLVIFIGCYCKNPSNTKVSLEFF